MRTRSESVKKAHVGVLVQFEAQSSEFSPEVPALAARVGW